MKHAKCYKENYPRPQFVRDSFVSLNGEWAYCFDDENKGEELEFFKAGLPSKKTIIVPFSYQTECSQVNDKKRHDIIWYEKEIVVSDNLLNKCVMLTFEGADYETKVWVNGMFIGKHVGGYCRFQMDIAPALKDGKGTIIVRCEDTYKCTQPRGKQKWLDEPFGCWYPETNGIWKTIWYEVVNKQHLSRIKTTPIEENYNVECEYEIANYEPNLSLRTIVSFADKELVYDEFKVKRENHTFTFDISNDLDAFKIHWWAPRNPQLYDVTYQLLRGGTIIDEVKSYFGFRIFKTKGNALMLNLNPTYLRLTLEQGYYNKSGLTVKNEQEIIDELNLTKAMGFNGLRMHQKIADERLYYYCDIMGLFAWCEMPSTYEFKDTAIENITREWMEIVKQHYNHPSIICWVPFNESWGVNRLTSSKKEASLTCGIYHLTKAFDPMRPVICNDGWEHTTSDIITLHNYSTNGAELLDFYKDLESMLKGDTRPNYSQSRLPFVDGFTYKGQPIMIDEFAGIGFEVKDKGWGYGEQVSSEEKYLERLESLVDAILSMPSISGFCVTQTTDVYQEINGILTIDRQSKVDITKVNKIISKKRV